MSKKVGYVSHPIYLEHDTGRLHPERSGRLLAIERKLKSAGVLEKLVGINAYAAGQEEVELVHKKEHIERVKLASEGGDINFGTPDCVMSKKTYEVSLWSAGGVLAAIDEVMSPSEISQVFCAVRPPGHHAEEGLAMGFCFFNNIAIGARYLKKKYKVDKIFILDWDVHHGNGTQHIFEEEESIYYASIHEDPRYCYPGTGYAQEQGSGKGRGYTLNCPMLPMSEERDYLEEYKLKILPAIELFKPDIILVSAGFDAHKDDPLANLNLTEGGYKELTEGLLQVSQAVCNGRIVSVLEGGYNLLALGNSISEHINALMK